LDTRRNSTGSVLLSLKLMLDFCRDSVSWESDGTLISADVPQVSAGCERPSH